MDAQKSKSTIIRDLQEIFPTLFEDGAQFSLEKLPSKKNMVFSLHFNEKPIGFPQDVVVKCFRTPNAEKEITILKKLQKQELLIPSTIFFEEPYIIMEMIEGPNLSDFINDNLQKIEDLSELDSYHRDRILFSIRKLATWVAILHQKNILQTNMLSEIIVLNHGDTRLRDFIINQSNDEIYGCDFEDAYEGNHLDDLAWICCSLLDTNPGIFQTTEPKHKIELINVFLKEYYRVNHHFSFSFNYFAERLIDDLNEVIDRRDLNISQVRKHAILKNITDNF